MQEQFMYGTETLTYQLFPIIKSGGARLPLLLWIEGSNEGIEDRIQKDMQQICQSKNINLAIIYLKSSQRFENVRICKTIQKFVFEIRKQYQMDVCKTYLAGYGTGAYGVSQLLSKYPRLFAAAILINSYGDPYQIRNAKEVPMWFIYGSEKPKEEFGVHRTKETMNILKDGRDLQQSLRNVGFQCKSTELTDNKTCIELFEKQGIDWLLRQNRRAIFRVEMIMPSVFRIDDYFMSSCYLIEGKDNALLIDTGMGEGDFKGIVDRLTSKPVILAITHPHPDHMYHAGLFQKIYIHEDAADKFESIFEEMRNMDISQFDNMYGMKLPELKNKKAMDICRLKDGDCLDLGGGCHIEVIFLPGHTAYDCVFVDDMHQLVFTGDAVGSGYTVGIPTSRKTVKSNIENYKNTLDNFLIRYADRVKEYGFLGGHFIQENGCDDTKQEDYLSNQSTYFNPLSLQVVKDMSELCAKILMGEYDNEMTQDEYSWSYGSARISGHFS